MRRAFATLAPILLVLLVVSCGTGQPGPRSFEFRGATMGTTYTVKVVADDLPEVQRVALDEGILAELDLVNRLMSHYLETSELSRFNDHASTDPFPISPETVEVFRWSLEVGGQSGGALDVTVGALVDAWGFGPPGQPAEPPSSERIQELLAATGNELLALDESTLTLSKGHAELRCDLSSTAKGYAVDRIAERVLEVGFDRFLVEVGGEIRVRGRNELGEPWQIAVERPESAERAIHRMIPMAEGAMATSGDYRNYYEVDGKRVSHIIDPRTGHPIDHRLASVSVLDPLCVRADAFATALLVLGPGEGYRLAEELGLPALFLVRDDDGGFTQQGTSRFQALVGQEGGVALPASPAVH